MARLADDSWRLTLEAYPRTVDLRCAYADVDSFQHLNNVALARYFEEGRAEMNMQLFGVDSVVRPSGGVQLLFASVQIEYLAQGQYPGDVTVGTAVSRVGGASFGHAGGLFQGGRCIAICEAVTVYAVDGRSRPLPDDVRSRLGMFQAKT